ncbi:MAG: hypothetical protein Q7R60_03350 [bacterium]|nr:hypothetical protein [bacterium]
MSEISDTARRIIKAGTPTSCVGCYNPILRGIYLSGKVEDSSMTEPDAINELGGELTEKCKFGHLRKKLGEQCMYGVNSTELESPARARQRIPNPWER